MNGQQPRTYEHNPMATGPRAYGQQAAGQPVHASAYTTCQHEEVSPPIRELGPTVLVKCSDPSVMMAGYYRSCARHILQLTHRSMAQLLTMQQTTNVHSQAQLRAGMALIASVVPVQD